MKELLEKRLKELKGEKEAGEKLFNELSTKRASVRAALLRIDGAILALQELCTGAVAPAPPSDVTAEK